MTKLKKEELLGWFEDEVSRYAFLQITHPHLAQKPTKKGQQAYQQIKEMIQKPEVTEEWIDKKARELNIQLDFPFKDRFTFLRDFICSLVEGVHVSCTG